jgi:hypothetical protein
MAISDLTCFFSVINNLLGEGFEDWEKLSKSF